MLTHEETGLGKASGQEDINAFMELLFYWGGEGKGDIETQQ